MGPANSKVLWYLEHVHIIHKHVHLCAFLVVEAQSSYYLISQYNDEEWLGTIQCCNQRKGYLRPGHAGFFVTLGTCKHSTWLPPWHDIIQYTCDVHILYIKSTRYTGIQVNFPDKSTPQYYHTTFAYMSTPPPPRDYNSALTLLDSLILTRWGLYIWCICRKYWSSIIKLHGVPLHARIVKTFHIFVNVVSVTWSAGWLTGF